MNQISFWRTSVDYYFPAFFHSVTSLLYQRPLLPRPAAQMTSRNQIHQSRAFQAVSIHSLSDDESIRVSRNIDSSIHYEVGLHIEAHHLNSATRNPTRKSKAVCHFTLGSLPMPGSLPDCKAAFFDFYSEHGRQRYNIFSKRYFLTHEQLIMICTWIKIFIKNQQAW